MNDRYIIGNDKYPERVIEALEKEGGCNSNNLSGNDSSYVYYIDLNGDIKRETKNSFLGQFLIKKGYQLYPEPDYKYKIGDKIPIADSGTKIMTIDEIFSVRGYPYYRIKESNRPFRESSIELLSKRSISTWIDMISHECEIKGYVINDQAFIEELISDIPTSNKLKRVFSSHSKARSALAMSQISQLIELPAYGGWCLIGDRGYAITLSGGIEDGDIKPVINQDYLDGSILRFHTREQAELFLKYNEQLVKDYLMIE